jgi:hypothetical protein
MLPLRNVAALMAPNFFLLLLASMYLVLCMEIKTLGTACTKTALLILWSVKDILTIIYFVKLNQSFNLIYQLYLLTVHYIIFISLSYFGMTVQPSGSTYLA